MPRPIIVLFLSLALAGCGATIGPPATPVAITPTGSPGASPTAATAATPASPQPTAVPVPMVSSVAFFDAVRGLVVGSAPDGRGMVWRTADGGRTWSAVTVDAIQLTFVTVSGSSLAWATPRCVIEPISGTGCGILASTDAGLTWRTVSDQSVDGLSFVDALHGWGVAPGGPGEQGGGVLASSNGGKSWTPLPAAPCARIGWPVAVTFVSRLHGWVGCAGEPGAGMAPKGIAETTDGGRTWRLRARAMPPGAGFPPSLGSIGLSDYLAGIAMRPSGVGLAWESRGGTLRTADGGRTWTTMPPGGSDAGPTPAGGWAVTDRDWFILLWSGNAQATILYATHDGGASWQAVSQVPAIP